MVLLELVGQKHQRDSKVGLQTKVQQVCKFICGIYNDMRRMSYYTRLSTLQIKILGLIFLNTISRLAYIPHMSSNQGALMVNVVLGEWMYFSFRWIFTKKKMYHHKCCIFEQYLYTQCFMIMVINYSAIPWYISKCHMICDITVPWHHRGTFL